MAIMPNLTHTIGTHDTSNTSYWGFDTGTVSPDYKVQPSGYLTWRSEPLETKAVVQYNIKYEEVREMRGLFHVVLVDYITEDIEEFLVIADNAEKAKIKALLEWGEEYPSHDVDDLDVICNKLGDIRKKQEVQKVRVIGEDE